MSIIVNASGAKVGGAKTIVESYVKWIEENDFENRYVFIVGFNLTTINKNIKVIFLPTSGFYSMFFSILGVIFFCIKYKSRTVFSFMNLNIILPFFNRITYFHQAKFFSETNFKFYLYKFFLFFQKKSIFVVQNWSIKNKLESFLNSSKSIVVESWPGILVPDRKCEPHWYVNLRNHEGMLALCPYSDIRMSHKNFDLIYGAYDFFREKNIKVIITSENFHYGKNDVFYFAGNCSSSELHFLYERIDFVLFPSLFETVGLPIFEAQYYGLPVILNNVEYVKDLLIKFPELNVIVLDKYNMLGLDIKSLKRKLPEENSMCFKGEWGNLSKVINLMI